MQIHIAGYNVNNVEAGFYVIDDRHASADPTKLRQSSDGIICGPGRLCNRPAVSRRGRPARLHGKNGTPRRVGVESGRWRMGLVWESVS